MRLPIASLLRLALCLVTLPAAAQVVYDNGAINGTTDAWQISFGFAVSNSFTVLAGAANVTGMSFGSWMVPGDVLTSAVVAITSSEFGGTSYFDQTVNFTQSGCVANQFGFNVCTESGTFGSNVNLAAGTYWLTLDDAETNTTNDPVYWDENSGPSSASDNSVGTIPSESFTLRDSPYGRLLYTASVAFK